MQRQCERAFCEMRADPIAVVAWHGLHEGLHGLTPLPLGRAAYLLHDSRRQAMPVALAGVTRAWHRHCAPARLRRLLPSLWNENMTSTSETPARQTASFVHNVKEPYVERNVGCMQSVVMLCAIRTAAANVRKTLPDLNMTHSCRSDEPVSCCLDRHKGHAKSPFVQAALDCPGTGHRPL